MSLLWTNFYDDFPHLGVKAEGDGAWAAAEEFFDLVGWKVSTKPSKRKTMAAEFEVLGVVVDFAQSHAGNFELRNKPDRIVAIG